MKCIIYILARSPQEMHRSFERKETVLRDDESFKPSLLLSQCSLISLWSLVAAKPPKSVAERNLLLYPAAPRAPFKIIRRLPHQRLGFSLCRKHTQRESSYIEINLTSLGLI